MGGLESNGQLLNHSSQGKVKWSRQDEQAFDSRARRGLLNVNVADIRGKEKSMASRHMDHSCDIGGKEGEGGRERKEQEDRRQKQDKQPNPRRKHNQRNKRQTSGKFFPIGKAVIIV